MSYVFQGGFNPITSMPPGGMDPYDPVTNPNGMGPVVQMQAPQYQMPQMQGSGITGFGNPGQYGFTPQPTGGGQQLAGLMAMQQAQFAPLLQGQGYDATTTTTTTGGGDDTGGDDTGGDDTGGGGGDDSGGDDTTTTTTTGGGGGGESTTLINQDWINQYLLEHPEGFDNIDLSGIGFYNQEFLDNYLQDYTPNENIQGLIDQWNLDNPYQTDYSGYYDQDQMDASNNDFLNNYLTNNPVDYSGYFTQDQMDADNADFLSNYQANNPVDYSGYFTQAQVDQMLSGIGGLNTDNPGQQITYDR